MESNLLLIFQILFWTIVFNRKDIKEIYHLIKGLMK